VRLSAVKELAVPFLGEMPRRIRPSVSLHPWAA
jgi:hypothetical protein